MSAVVDIIPNTSDLSVMLSMFVSLFEVRRSESAVFIPIDCAHPSLIMTLCTADCH